MVQLEVAIMQMEIKEVKTGYQSDEYLRENNQPSFISYDENGVIERQVIVDLKRISRFKNKIIFKNAWLR